MNSYVIRFFDPPLVMNYQTIKRGVECDPSSVNAMLLAKEAVKLVGSIVQPSTAASNTGAENSRAVCRSTAGQSWASLLSVYFLSLHLNSSKDRLTGHFKTRLGKKVLLRF